MGIAGLHGAYRRLQHIEVTVQKGLQYLIVRSLIMVLSLDHSPEKINIGNDSYRTATAVCDTARMMLHNCFKGREISNDKQWS